MSLFFVLFLIFFFLSSSSLADKPDSNGLLLIPPKELKPAVERWVKAGYQVNIHCIGDLANRLTIDAFEAVINQVGLEQDLRLRIEHAQIIALDDIPRIVPLKIIPSFQPTHATSDMVILFVLSLCLSFNLTV